MIFRKIEDLEPLMVFINNGHWEFYKRNSVIESYDITNLIATFKKLFQPFKLLFLNDKKNLKHQWLIYESANNLKALSPLKDDNKSFVWINKDLIFKYILFYKIIWLLPLVVYLIQNKKLKWFLEYYEALGIKQECDRLLKKHRPEKIIFANDHNPYQVALKLAAHQNNIKTYFFQHACTISKMPPLDFTVSFLDGEDSFQKYKSCGPIKGKVELIGSMMMNTKDQNINESIFVQSIGIALNEYDKIEDTILLIDKLKSDFEEIQIHIRLHPNDKRKFLYKDDNVFIKDSNKDSVFDYLSRIDLLIAGDSSIHLEATMLNIVAVYYKITVNEVNDIYGFGKNGLVYVSKSYKDLRVYIGKEVEKKSNVLDRAGYYDEYYRNQVNYIDVLKKYELIS